MEGGMEGYDLREQYRFQYMRGRHQRYYRVWHNDTYYETCGPKLFAKCFQETQP